MGRTESEKKSIERRDALAMVQLLELDATLVDDEKPDFRLVFSDGRSVGVEHTLAVAELVASGRGPIKYLKAEVLAALQRARLDTIVSLRIPEALGSLLATRKAREQECAAVMAVAREAIEHDAKMSYEHLHDIASEDGDIVWVDPKRRTGTRDIANRGFRAVVALSVIPAASPAVMVSQPGAMQRNALIQAAIDDKADKVEAYRSGGIAEQWLLVVGSSGTGASLVMPEPDDEFVSQFDRTVFFDRFEGRCRFLRTRAA